MSNKSQTKVIKAIMKAQFVYTSMGFRYGQPYTTSSLKHFSEEALMTEIREVAIFCAKCVSNTAHACIEGYVDPDLSKERCTRLNKVLHDLKRAS